MRERPRRPPDEPGEGRDEDDFSRCPGCCACSFFGVPDTDDPLALTVLSAGLGSCCSVDWAMAGCWRAMESAVQSGCRACSRG